MPVVMTRFSLLGVIVLFGIVPLYLRVWSVGVMTCLLAVNYTMPRDVKFNQQKQQLTTFGSWLPLGLVVATFILHYQVFRLCFNDSPALDALSFVISICLLYGIFSGIFIARCLGMLRAIKQTVNLYG